MGFRQTEDVRAGRGGKGSRARGQGPREGRQAGRGKGHRQISLMGASAPPLLLPASGPLPFLPFLHFWKSSPLGFQAHQPEPESVPAAPGFWLLLHLHMWNSTINQNAGGGPGLGVGAKTPGSVSFLRWTFYAGNRPGL